MEIKRLCATCANAVKNSGRVERCKLVDDTADRADRAEIAKQIAKAAVMGSVANVPNIDYFCQVYKAVMASTIGLCADYKKQIRARCAPKACKK